MSDLHTPFDFPEVEGEKEWSAEKYTPSHRNWRLASTLLTASENLREVYKKVSRTAGHDAGDGRLLQHFFIYQGANALESVYWLGKYHQYGGARGRCRVLYETYLVLRALNRDQEQAAEIYDRIRSEANSSPVTELHQPPEEQADALHNLRKDERKRVEKRQRTKSYTDFWMQLSDRGSHPASLIGLLSDGNYTFESERSVFTIALTFAFGIAAQYLRTFRGSKTRWRIQPEVDQIIIEIQLAIEGHGLPTLFREELFFWDPIRYNPRTLDMGES